MSYSDLENLVIQENAKAHDACAIHHDLNVPYINRKKTREYYWNLILTQLKENQRTFEKASVCELGCGTGTFSELAFHHNALSYVGIDVSEQMIHLARKKNQNKKASYELSSLNEFSSKNRSKFDVIISSSFIHHLVDIEKSLEQIQSMLKPQGIYIALHEPILPRKHSFTEQVDNLLQILLGYSFGEMNFLKRLILALAGYWRKDRWGQTIPFFSILSHYNRIKKLILRLPDHAPTKDKENIDLVDYQLNQEFSLQNCLKGKGTVMPYTYLCLIDLLRRANIKNYELFVLIKHEEHKKHEDLPRRGKSK